MDPCQVICATNEAIVQRNWKFRREQNAAREVHRRGQRGLAQQARTNSLDGTTSAYIRVQRDHDRIKNGLEQPCQSIRLVR